MKSVFVFLSLFLFCFVFTTLAAPPNERYNDFCEHLGSQKGFLLEEYEGDSQQAPVLFAENLLREFANEYNYLGSHEGVSGNYSDRLCGEDSVK